MISPPVGDPKDLSHVRDRVRLSISIPGLTPDERAVWIQSIRTYGEQHWAFAKNEYLSPIHCSRAGWNCIGRDLLQCRSCQHRLKVQFNSKLKQKAIEELSKEISTQQIFRQHDKLCPFYGITHASIARVLPADSLSILAEYQNRYQQIVDEFSSMIESETLCLRPVPEKLSKYDVASTLALCGWQPSKKFSNIIECEICARARSKPANLPELRPTKRFRADGNDMEVLEPIFSIGDRVASRASSPLPGHDLFGRKTASAELSVLWIDPIGDHHSYCPWIKGSSPGIPPGWDSCQHVIERDKRVTTTDRNADEIDQSCRNILKRLRSFRSMRSPSRQNQG